MKDYFDMRLFGGFLEYRLRDRISVKYLDLVLSYYYKKYLHLS